MSLLSAYQDLITSEHRGKPRYMATVTALLKPLHDIFELGVYMDDYFDLDEATGAQEDILGQIVGQSRQMPFDLITTGNLVLDNETYRVMLKAKIAKNLWKGGIADLEETWQNLFGNRIRIKDNQDMTIEVQMDAAPTTAAQELILRGQVVPKPQSVGVNYNVIWKGEGTQYYAIAPHIYRRYAVAQILRASTQGVMYVGVTTSNHKSISIMQAAAVSNAETNGKENTAIAMMMYRRYRV